MTSESINTFVAVVEIFFALVGGASIIGVVLGKGIWAVFFSSKFQLELKEYQAKQETKEFLKKFFTDFIVDDDIKEILKKEVALYLDNSLKRDDGEIKLFVAKTIKENTEISKAEVADIREDVQENRKVMLGSLRKLDRIEGSLDFLIKSLSEKK